MREQAHLNLLHQVGALASLVTQSEDIDSFLQSAVEMVALHLRAEVCSIYLYDETTDELTLSATKGLHPDAVGVVRMPSGSGLVGRSLALLEPICEGRAPQHPDFRYFEEAREDGFNSFIGVPIHRGQSRIGVMTVQRKQTDAFTAMDVGTLRTMASQLAGVLENARLMMQHETHAKRPAAARTVRETAELPPILKGQGAAPGYAHAPAAVASPSHALLLNGTADQSDTYTATDLDTALQATADQLVDLQAELTSQLPESASLIFSAHLMILKDRSFRNKIHTRIERGTSVPAAVREVAEIYITAFEQSPSAHLREKAQDVRDIAGRILKNLREPDTEDGHAPLVGAKIVIAETLYPSEVLKLAADRVCGVVLVSGGLTSHVAILMRSLGLPLLIVEEPRLMAVAEGTPLIMDAHLGNLFLDPAEAVLAEFRRSRAAESAGRLNVTNQQAITRTSDGERIHLLANINLLGELTTAQTLKAEGIGLYRSEFPFLVRASFPSEEEQVAIYKHLCERARFGPLTFRTLDIGGDKVLPYSHAPQEANPELGLRSIRFSLKYPKTFHQQLRAVLRAAVDLSDFRLLFPLISSVDEFRRARQAVEVSLKQLQHHQEPHHDAPALGVMVELPATLGIIDELAAEADFFAIGTNDLTQYLLGVDRTNPQVADYYRSDHPAILRALRRIVEAAAAAGIPVSVCGEMTHHPQQLAFLVGIGIRTFSVTPSFLPRVQRTLTRLKVSDAERFAKKLLAAGSLADVDALLSAAAAPH
ncbi:MAG: phosphoenolpyruvate--protein phosphotransferase [Desulfosarcinaceae bacterium]|nr:phosphoenolpyruvate--protein phosphotransferase [Desulfosarcinaceae bacterium]